MFPKKNKQLMNIMLILGLVVVAGVLYRYNSSKSGSMDSMSSNKKLSANSAVLSELAPSGEQGPQGPGAEGAAGVQPKATLEKKPYLAVSGMASPSAGNTCNNQPVMDPKDLLPQDKNSEWAKINPANSDLKNLNMLNAGHHFGINTVGSSLRNANLQLRSEPAIPQVDVGPWNNTTIEADSLRRPLEIGGKE